MAMENPERMNFIAELAAAGTLKPESLTSRLLLSTLQYFLIPTRLLLALRFISESLENRCAFDPRRQGRTMSLGGPNLSPGTPGIHARPMNVARGRPVTPIVLGLAV